MTTDYPSMSHATKMALHKNHAMVGPMLQGRVEFWKRFAEYANIRERKTFDVLEVGVMAGQHADVMKSILFPSRQVLVDLWEWHDPKVYTDANWYTHEIATECRERVILDYAKEYADASPEEIRIPIAKPQEVRYSVGLPTMSQDFPYDEECIRNWGPNVFQGKSHAVANMLFTMGQRFDLIYIDACHQYLSVKQDLEAWFPLIKEDGYLAGHDLLMSGVRAAVMEFQDEFNLYRGFWSGSRQTNDWVLALDDAEFEKDVYLQVSELN